MSDTSCARGFTVLETAIVLAVVAVIMTMALGVYKMLRGAGDELKTGSDLGSAVSETVNYAVTYGRLPSAAQFDSLIGEKYGVAYVPADNLTDLAYSRTNSVCLAADSDPSFTAFSVFRGENRKTVTLEELKSLMKCFSNAGPLRVITENLPDAVTGENYAAEISAAGGRPFYGDSAGGEYDWCVEPLLNGGEAGVYGDYLVRKDPALVSLDCEDKRSWFRGTKAVFRIDDFDDEGIIGVSSIPLRIYVRDDNETIFRDVSLSSDVMAYYPPPNDENEAYGRIYETDNSSESPIKVEFWGQDREIVELGVGMGNAKPFTSSCVWWNEAPFKSMKLKNNIVAVYMMSIVNSAGPAGSNTKNGYTVAFIPASEKLKPTLCGDAATGLGYGVNTLPGRRSTGALQGHSIGVEFDVASRDSYNDEWIKDPWRAVSASPYQTGREAQDHVAIVSSQNYSAFISDDVADKKSSAADKAVTSIDGVPKPAGKRAYTALQASNWHGRGDGAGNYNDSCGDPDSKGIESGCYSNDDKRFGTKNNEAWEKGEPLWLDNVFRRVRIELDGRCDASCGTCGSSVKDPEGILVSVWLSNNDIPAMWNMSESFNDVPGNGGVLVAQSCKPFPKQMGTVRMGITVGLGDTVYTTSLSSFKGGVITR